MGCPWESSLRVNRWLVLCYVRRLHMFGAISKLFKKSEPAPAPTHPTGPTALGRAATQLPKVEATGRPSVSRAVSSQAAGADDLTIPYASIIKLIPQELWGKLAPAGVAGYNFTIGRKSVLEQLPSGSVKINFGELRRGAPAGVFINTPAEDGRLVDLPLSEILAQLHPDAFACRPDQSRTEVSPDVPDLFGSKGERLAPLRVMEKKEVSNSTSFTRQNPPAGRSGQPEATSHGQKALSSPTIPSSISPLPFTPTAAPALKLPVPSPSSPSGQKVPAPIQFPLPKPAAQTAAPVARALPKAQAPLPKPATANQTIAFHSTPGTPTFLISLDAIAEGWPDGVRQELAQLKIPDAKIALPSVEICEGLKRGRVQYPWRTLRSWIQPTPIYASPSPHDEQILELPLRTLTPIFLDFIRANPVNRQSADAENITEFFRKAGQATGTSPELLQPLFEPNSIPAAHHAAPAPTPPIAHQTPTPVAPPSAPSAAAQTHAPAGLDSEPIIENGAICLPFALIAAGWPDPILRDIAQFGLAGSRVELPLGSVEIGLKTGRLEFTWRELCGWLNPPSKPAQVSINGETRVALQLGLIAPIFLKNRGSDQGRKRTSVAEGIPDLFSAAGKPLPPPPAPEPPAAPSVTPSAAPPVVPPAAVAVPKKAPTNLSELFGEPEKKTWTPNEIVQRTAQLPGVAGSLIALQDGLLVASSMPQQMKTETIAAFVPQIFGRMNQYSKDLQMGETKAVSFTVDVGTIQVYNAGIIYFASLGKKGLLLPLAELQLIAGELGRHTK